MACPKNRSIVQNQNKLAVPDRLADLADQLLSVADHDLIAKVKP